MLVKLRENNGSMAVYTSVVLLSMLLILTAVFFTSSAIRKSGLTTIMKVKESYEADNKRASEIYDALTGNIKEEAEYVKSGLILHYDGINNIGNGHDNTATVWKDLSGNGNDGNLSKTPNTSQFYWEDNCITLSGSSNTSGIYIDTPVNLNNLERTIIYTIDANKLSGSIWGDTDSSNFNGLFNYQSFIANRGSGSSGQCKYDYTFNKVGVYNYAITLTNNELKFYENGVLKSTVINSVGLATSNNIRILSAGNSSQHATNLKVYNFLVYNRVLNDEEIQQNYQAIKNENNF